MFRALLCPSSGARDFNPLNAELNPICHLLALLGAHHIFNVSGLRDNVDYHIGRFVLGLL